MGGYHLHAFRFGGGFSPTEYSTHQIAIECGSRAQDENQVLLTALSRRKGRTFSSEYDFGDSWQHEVKVEKILPYDPERFDLKAVNRSLQLRNARRSE